MKIIVNTHKIILEKDEIINAGEYNIQECNFEFSEEYDNLVKVAIFSSQTNSYKVNINHTNKCNIPIEVLESENVITIGVYGYEVEDEELVKRYSPTPVFFKVENGSYKVGEEVEPPTPSIVEQILQELESLSEQIYTVDVDAEQTETGAEITITDKTGTQKTVELYDGEDGTDGVDGYSPKASVTKLGSSATITIIDKTGTTSAIINDGINGQDGQNGANATINGVNTLTLQAGSNISLDQQGSTMTISATGGSGGTSDYEDLDNLPTINNVELIGNKTTSDLGTNDYSTTAETIIGRFNNKPIYRKVFTTTLNKTETTISTNINNLENVYDLRAMYVSGNEIRPIPYANPSASYMQTMVYNKSTNIITIKSGAQVTLNGTTTVIIEYTKTTD